MNTKSSTFISGILAVGVYLSIVGLVLFYFNTRNDTKSIHYVKKNEDRIRVTMSAPKNKQKQKTKKATQKKTPPVKKVLKTPKVKQASKKNTVKKRVDKRKKIIKEKIVKKAKVKPKVIKKPIKKRTIKKVNKPKDLFANVASSKKSVKKKSKPNVLKKVSQSKIAKRTSASDLVSNSQKVQKKSDKGIQNAYFALIEEKLKGWPAQSEYAGEMAKVWIKVEPSGKFIYKVITASANANFNEGLIAYLKQLQRFGFGKHKANRAYEINVEFVATD
jgi:protein TonB